MKRYTKLVLLTISWLPVAMTTAELVNISKINGKSMRPTLNPSDKDTDWVILKLFRPAKNLQRNDIILFKSPFDPKILFCKRVKGLDKDLIRLEHENIRVPRGHIWVEGDNVHSVDSRTFGPISKGLILGKVKCIVWPPRRWGTDLNKWAGRDAMVNEDDKMHFIDSE
ncbi:hypothetical protein KAFR_0A02300 [Kazachstania africana CBS 2517]|uniref:Mitochondrial inner membrane protease subunit 2 n=1 Tax=Kazachstania africana (strain ATCC 22294 / BCRC 22015 / CBS 2517 / CECT 1963 / NBRC 1671 / NRRL Y-8276) TaxID=1071382 RepID=H2AMR8_KAZAF|nr:hypothetical protein KAFR_0A02300 [Kazachstania africana CBS 2517]CCF55668.1 hypothetical protein KAFR_0A02300 [Kazachstania africana CBS 2517]